MESKRKKIIIIICILMFIILLTILIGYDIKKKKNNLKTNMDITTNEVINLLSYIPNSLIRVEHYNDAYYGEFVTFKDVLPMVLSPIFISEYVHSYTPEEILNLNLEKYNINDGNIFLKTEINEYLMKQYNYNLSLLDDINNDIKITNLDNKYIAIDEIKIDNISVLAKHLIAITDAYINADEAIITEKVLFYELKDNKYYVYKNTNIYNKDNIIKVYDKIDENGKELHFNDIGDKIREYAKNYNYVFKHTFKKNKTGYYWYSTELVEED